MRIGATILPSIFLLLRQGFVPTLARAGAMVRNFWLRAVDSCLQSNLDSGGVWMPVPIGRRELLAGAGAAVLLGGLEGCVTALGAKRPPSAPSLQLTPVRASTDRITRITVCTRPFRAQGPRLDTEKIGSKLIVHNYGHGGSGWSLSWGSSSIAVRKAMATGEREIAVIGCGALGLTSALLLQRAGARVTIYAKELPPAVRSSLATGLWTPDSRICLQENATPAFKQQWEEMARTSFQTYQNFLGLPGTPVEFIDNYHRHQQVNRVLPDWKMASQVPVFKLLRVVDVDGGVSHDEHPWSRPSLDLILQCLDRLFEHLDAFVLLL